MNKVTVIGAGLAGCEAAYALSVEGIPVDLYDMKPQKFSPAHHSEGFAELVCTNSLKSDSLSSAGGLLKAEMRLLGSLLLECADKCKVPAGGALAVDRDDFSRLVTAKIESNPLITVHRQEITEIPEGNVIIATGPLTSDELANRIHELVGVGSLSFFDAAAPIIELDSIDKNEVFFAARYGRGGDDYINCPFNKEQYDSFYHELVSAESAQLKDFDHAPNVYEGCMPIEILAKRGYDTLRFGPLKPVGLTDPATGKRPWAVVQLRRENSAGTLYNLVGFQTNLKFVEQQRVFSMIPGLRDAVFSRYGVMHRNTFLDSPRILNENFTLRKNSQIIFAGQITGVEGYMESAASGIIAAKQLAKRLKGEPELILPEVTMLGALCRYVCDESVKNFQPMGASMGLLPPNTARIKDKQLRYKALSERALESMKANI